MKKLLAASVATIALTLSACDGGNEVPTAELETDTGTDFAVFDDDAYPVAEPLNEQQQANYDAMDRDAIAGEYDENRKAMSTGATSDSMATDEAGSTESGSEGSANAASDDTLRPRSQMDFAFLDRNGDDQLSVAEYAIWAVRADPTEPKANDQTRPFISPEQINEAGATFFYFDEDGNTYLSKSEFEQARASARTP